MKSVGLKESREQLIKALTSKEKNKDINKWLINVNTAFAQWEHTKNALDWVHKYMAESIRIQAFVQDIQLWVGALICFDLIEGRSCAILSERAGEYMQAAGINPWAYKTSVQQKGFVMTKERYMDILNQKCIVLENAVKNIRDSSILRG